MIDTKESFMNSKYNQFVILFIQKLTLKNIFFSVVN